MTREAPLAAASRRLSGTRGRGRPRKRPPELAPGPSNGDLAAAHVKAPPEAGSGHIPGTPPARPRASRGPERGAVASGASAPLAPRLLDVDGSAHYLSVSPWTIRDLYAAGRLPRVRLPLAGDRELRRLLFDRSDLDRLVEAFKELKEGVP
jgi:hypothetical protein